MGRGLAHAVAALLGGAFFAPMSVAQDKGRIEEGIAVYKEHCGTCHGENLVSPGPNSDLRQLKPQDRERFNRIVQNGRGQMPPWKGVVTDAEMDAVWAYIMSERQ